jgi:hypothetical protein
LITAGAVATSGHLPRVLELVQFLSIYCTSLSSQQQNRVSEFQVASFTHVSSSKAGHCDVCPGSCAEPSVLVMPTFTLISCVFVIGLLVVVFDMRNSSLLRAFASPIQDRLLGTSVTSNPVAAVGRSSLRHAIAAFCVRYFRSSIETCSSYVLMPCTFVFVLNARPSAFSRASSSDRAMTVMLPILTLLFRALVIRQRVVDLTLTDQKQLYTSSVCSCVIAAALSVSFALASVVRQPAASFASDSLAHYIVLVLLVVQLILQTVIRRRAPDPSIFDNTDWPWTLASSHGSSAVFSFDELIPRLAIGSMKSVSSSSAIVAVKFFVLNYVVLSQMAMIVAGIASSGATSPSSIEASSVVIGTIPLVTSGVLLLNNMAKFIRFLWQNCYKKPSHVGPRLSDQDGFY